VVRSSPEELEKKKRYKKKQEAGLGAVVQMKNKRRKATTWRSCSCLSTSRQGGDGDVQEHLLN